MLFGHGTKYSAVARVGLFLGHLATIALEDSRNVWNALVTVSKQMCILANLSKPNRLVSCPGDRVIIEEEVTSSICGTILGVAFTHLRAAGGTEARGAIEDLAGRGCVSSAVDSGAG